MASSDDLADIEPERDIAWPARDPGSATVLVDTDSTPLQDAYVHLLRQYVSGLKRPPPRELRMVRLECNYPGITGYSAASYQDRVFMLHAHREGEADPEYDWPSKHTICHWIYMPINLGEYVAEIWLSPSRLSGHNKSRGLAVRIPAISSTSPTNLHVPLLAVRQRLRKPYVVRPLASKGRSGRRRQSVQSSVRLRPPAGKEGNRHPLQRLRPDQAVDRASEWPCRLRLRECSANRCKRKAAQLGHAGVRTDGNPKSA